ncbi:PP2C family protein-serine/threonine phosphatase [Streptomyces sp. CA-142005]|uniref:PP2C family protein-serine/threonine phosphatase n=1 Tax=Streptomyces sp. CA-142005 TaxID=3240052 RepID=UPI003D8FF27E
MAIENARLYGRLRQATEEFQRRLLPTLPALPHLEPQARCQPSSDAPRIGGDWYDLIHLPGDVPFLMVGDVMGHGLEAATLMSQISNVLRVVAYDEQEPPSRILHRLDEILHDLHGGPMATVVVARLEHAAADGSRLLRWASAGHLPPLLITPDHQARYLHMESAGHPLGVDPTLPRPDHERMLPAGATLLLPTDGLAEHRDQPLDEGMAGHRPRGEPRRRASSGTVRRPPGPERRRLPGRRRHPDGRRHPVSRAAASSWPPFRAVRRPGRRRRGRRWRRRGAPGRCRRAVRCRGARTR